MEITGDFDNFGSLSSNSFIIELTIKMADILTKISAPTTTPSSIPFGIKLGGTNYGLWS